MNGFYLRRGIMLVTTLMISALIIILFISSISLLFNSSKETNLAVERESALIAAKAAYQQGLNEVEAEVKRGVKLENISHKDSGWHSCNSFASEDAQSIPGRKPQVESRYAYKKGVIVAAGRVMSGSGRYVTRFLKTNFLVETRGITADEIIPTSAFDNKTVAQLAGKYNAAITSVYSNATQLPFDVWIGLKSSRTDPRYYLNGAYRPIKQKGEIVTADARGFVKNYSSLIAGKDTGIGLLKSLELTDSDWHGRLFYDPRSVADYENRKEQQKMEHESGAEPAEEPAEPSESAETEPEANPEDLYKSEIDLEKLETEIGLSKDAFLPFEYDSEEKAANCEINYSNPLIKKNLWLIPYNRTVYCNDDLLLSEGSILVVTGNLVVRGNIRGTGVVIVLNRLVFAPRNIVHEESKVGKGFNAKLNTDDNVVVYASNGIRVVNYTDRMTNGDPSFLATMPYYLPVRIAEYMKKHKIKSSQVVNIADFYRIISEYFSNSDNYALLEKELKQWCDQNNISASGK